MLILNPQYFDAWTKISSPTARYWIRSWQDGLYEATPPEWSFSPLSIGCLAKIWRAFSAVPGETDWGKPQRKAIMFLARQRSHYPDGRHFGAPTTDDGHRWDAFWTTIESVDSAFLADLVEDATLQLTSDAVSLEALRLSTSVLAAEALRSGYSRFELFVRAGTGILDPAGKRSEPAQARIAGFLAHLLRRPTSEFLIWTEVLCDGGPLTTGAAKRLASRSLQTSGDWPSGTGFARLGGRAFALTRGTYTHSLTAFLQHRKIAHDGLHAHVASVRRTGFTLATSSSVQDVASSDRPPWIHSLPRSPLRQYLTSSDPAVEPEAFADAIAGASEDPEKTIEVLCDAFDRQLGKNWPAEVARRYRAGLRSELGRRLRVALKESTNRYGKKSIAPDWVSDVTRTRVIDFDALASRIEATDQSSDPLLVERLRQVANAHTRFETWNSIPALLQLAKGIRNCKVHSGAWPADLTHVSAYIASLMLSAFALSFKQPAPQPSGSAAQPGMQRTSLRSPRTLRLDVGS